MHPALIRQPLRFRRSLAALIACGLMILAATAAACGDDGADDATSTATASATTATSAANTATATTTAHTPDTEAAFPIVIKHKYGETTIPAAPTRVVSVGYSEQDTILAFGVKPLGVREWYGGYPHAVWPWAQDELGDAEPRIIGSGELDMEAIATLDPDLILGITSGMTEDEYRLLSQIAPTVPQPGEFVDYGVPWREEVRIIGRALGMDDRAEEIIADVEAQFARVREEHPEFAGKTAAVAFYFNDQPGAYSSQDTRSRLMTELGFVIPEQFDQIAGDLFYFTVSAEQMSVLDTDVIAWLASTDQGLATIRQLPLRSQLRASAEGREVFVDVVVGGAFGFSSPLSIPYVLEHLVPKLAAAVDGDPATPVD